MLGTRIAPALGALLILTAVTAWADFSTTKRPPGPPPEAVDACAGLAAGDACTFVGRHEEEFEGECRLPPAAHPHGDEGDNAATSANSADEVTLALACMPTPEDMPAPPQDGE